MKKKSVTTKKPVIKRKATHKAATQTHAHASEHKEHPQHPVKPAKVEHPYPEDVKQEERVNQLIKDVREAFSRNQFAIPGDIDLQMRAMALTVPHHAPLPQTHPGPGAQMNRAA